MTTLDDLTVLAARDRGLAVVSTLRADGTIHSSVVNAGVMRDPFGGERVLAFVTYGPVKLANLRDRSHAALTFRSGWAWATAEGRGHLIGPDDPDPRVDTEGLRLLLRDVFSAAGGTHDDWDEYDRVMAAERRTVVVIEPIRIYGNS
jgi:PPOX class probable F420-dependent enzyme